MIEMTKLSETRFTKETYGMDNGIVWPTIHMEDNTYEPCDGWAVVGYCENPTLISCSGEYRKFAVMFEAIKYIDDGTFNEIEAGTLAWYHYDEIPQFTKIIGDS
jgi:hypothetical protein